MHRTWLSIALFDFLIAGILGILMRYAFVGDLEWLKFRNVMYAHYHTAMLGWMYLALFSLFISTFLKEKVNQKLYNTLFWITQFCVVGMLISYLIFGYHYSSIAFTLIHILSSYVFVVTFIKDFKVYQNSTIVSLFVKASIFFLILSTLALVLIYYLILTDSNLSVLYYAAVQFFLHFQLNGWFIFAVLALFFKFLEKREIYLPGKVSYAFFIFLTLSCFLTYAIAVTWSNPLPALFWINGIGVSLQLIALMVFAVLMKRIFFDLRRKTSGWTKSLLLFAIGSFCLKIVIQFAVVIPYLATIAYTVRNYVIGFIHLILLGCISTFILAIASEKKWINFELKRNRLGIVVLLAGILLSELVLIFQGTMLWASLGFIPFYHVVIFVVSLLMPIGVGLIFLGSVKSTTR